MSTSFDIVTSASTPLPSIEAARAIGRSLVVRGHEVRYVEDELPSPSDDAVTIVFAPHHVLPYLEVDTDALERSLSRTILIASARPSHPNWERSVALAERAGGVLDISDAGVTAFGGAGIEARRLRLGLAPDDPPGDATVADRPLDVVFLGTATPRRLRLAAAAAPWLARRRTDLRFTDAVATSLAPVEGFVTGEEKDRLLSSAKIVLNLHPADDPLFEWLRARDALRNGCLLVSELSSGATPLDPGLHFVSVDHGHLGPTIDRLLDEPDRLERIRGEGASFFREHVRLEDEATTILEAADDLAKGSSRRPQTTRPLVPPAPDPTQAPGERPLEDALLQTVTRQNAILKRLFVEIRGLRREIAHVRHSVEEPSEPLVAVTDTPGWARGGAEVSVIVSLHNYARYVREAMESALASEGVTVEIVVVDDRSTDDGPSVVRALMAECPEAQIRFIEQRVNTGVQRARNLAFSHARAPHAFVLDADNVVYPSGIVKLRDALVADPRAAFSYGIIERFNDEGGTGLMGTEGWDERRLARSHYIDAMAMVQVDAWREVGGYVTDPALELGWEDYDLWLSFASHGYRGTHVREIVGRYRIHGLSSLGITTLDTSELMNRLQARHARFFRQQTRASADE